MADKLKSFYKLLNDYIEKKDGLNDKDKEKYLRALVPIAKEYNIDLKQELTRKKRVYSNPLDNDLLLKTLIYQRYNNCIFNAAEIILPNSKEIKNNESFDYTRLQKKLIDKISELLIDKIGNYATDDINELYRELLINNDISTDKKISKLLNSVTDYESHIGIEDSNVFTVPSTKQTYKIFINTPYDKETFYFLNDYIERCITNGINYEMIGYQSNGLNKDHTILFASDDDIDIKLNILDKIAEEKENVIKAFGSPLEYASQINDSYYSITNIDTNDYNGYFNNICETAYYRVLAKLVINKIDSSVDQKIIESIIELDNVEITDKNPLNGKYNDNDFVTIKDLINKNLPDILNTIKIYMEQEDKMQLLVDEFKKSIKYISNIVEGKNKKNNENIAIRKD